VNAAEFVEATGLTYRQADHWARAGVFDVATSPGSGSPRAWSANDVEIARALSAVSGLLRTIGPGSGGGLTRAFARRVANFMRVHRPDRIYIGPHGELSTEPLDLPATLMVDLAKVPA
jgi:hypothetical protein